MFFIYFNIEQTLTQNIASRVDIQIKIDTLTISGDMSTSEVNIMKFWAKLNVTKKSTTKSS